MPVRPFTIAPAAATADRSTGVRAGTTGRTRASIGVSLVHWGRRIIGGVLFALAVIGPARRIHGGMIEDVGLALGQFGFDYFGNRNLLSGGIDFLATNRFVGNELDFGVADLSLVGPLSLAVSTGGRALSELEIAFRTADNPVSSTQPLRYLYNVDVGGQTARVEGSIFLDANLKVNGFGFYDLSLEYSSRQTIDREGRFANDSLTNDFDVGPIHVRGNIVADLLAVVTEPIFENAGLVNVFASFSGREQLRSAIAAQAQAGIEEPVASGSGRDAIPAGSADAVVFRGLVQAAGEQVPASAISGSSFVAYQPGVVPEPVVLILLLLGLPLVLTRRPR
jgi:hypothetical protein